MLCAKVGMALLDLADIVASLDENIRAYLLKGIGRVIDQERMIYAFKPCDDRQALLLVKHRPVRAFVDIGIARHGDDQTISHSRSGLQIEQMPVMKDVENAIGKDYFHVVAR